MHVLLAVVDGSAFLELFVPFDFFLCSAMTSSSSLALINKLKCSDAPGLIVTLTVKPAIADE